ncbi:PREDICTED: universal stress protein in QAH/OAS sulfhydrylase 3'region-like [Acropora digitifera]|uniref:universal stress protein in QAH/OAS sulfhydrylase 3'region-like n=1 Tax=Acropora digitifera TaxID=70779 RepID=UPI00077A86AC|nr:PREDICTED: universal stress protein in QAH/OAS sulfhydrylase 3'region-like [Acropora digitifera]XP_029184088.2 universal stress protein in QAH/OAS sulfhydrylase 3'region-like [Acropora millepora]XP_044179391.1 universal stress protein in QAH/OAS sulfhydrylase 3'region-like isoform X2 [Acropora millepora]
MAENRGRRKVLIAVDGSEHGDRAFDWYMSNLHDKRDSVIILHAFEIPPLPYSSGPFVFAYYEEWSEMVSDLREKAKEMMRGYEKACKEKKIHYQVILDAGKPAGSVICKEALNEKVDLIVTGSRGLGTARRTILGSVSDYVVHHTSCPVCVVPPRGK